MHAPTINGFKIAIIKKQDAFLNTVIHDHGIYVALNYEKIYNQDRIVKECTNIGTGYADGIGASIMLLFNGFKTKRYPGIDLFLDILTFPKPKKIYLLGGKEYTINKAAEVINKSYPNVDVVGYHHGYFKEGYLLKNILPIIKKYKPDFIFVGMGSPLQENIMFNLYKHYKSRYIGVGGSFKILTGEEVRAPIIIRKLGLEWLYRDILKPRRFQRDVNIPTYLINILKRKYK